MATDLPKTDGSPALARRDGSVYLCIDRCPIHGEFWAISLDGDTGGTRLTNGKCCGRWQRFKAWKMTPDRLRELANLFEQEADDLERRMDADDDSPNTIVSQPGGERKPTATPSDHGAR